MIYLYNSNFFGFLILGIILFFILRELWCWYWKINRVVELLEKIERNTRKEGDTDGKILVKNVISKV